MPRPEENLKELGEFVGVNQDDFRVFFKGDKGDPGESIVGPKGEKGDSIIGPKGADGRTPLFIGKNPPTNPKKGDLWYQD